MPLILMCSRMNVTNNGLNIFAYVYINFKYVKALTKYKEKQSLLSLQVIQTNAKDEISFAVFSRLHFRDGLFLVVPCWI